MKILCFLILFVSFVLQAEEVKVVDIESNKPLISATVSLKHIESGKKYNYLTDKDGCFEIPKAGKFEVKVSYIGYEQFTDTLSLKINQRICLKGTDIKLGEIVTTGQYAPRTIQESVYNISVIRDESIEKHGATNLRDALITENNMRISNDNILGSSISINGVSGQNVKIMIDGVPVIGRLNGNIDLSQINMNNVKQVEIIEGPMSAIYGTDALGGVINIITEDRIDNKFTFNFNSLAESVGRYNFDGGMAYNSGNHKFMLNGGRNFFGGFDVQDTSRNKQWKPKIQYFSDFQYIYNQSNYKLKYKIDFFRDFILNRGEPRRPYRETAFDDEYRTLRLNNSVFWNGTFGDSKYYDLTLNYSHYQRIKNTFLKDLVTLNRVLTKNPADQDTSEFNTYMLRGTFSDDQLTDKLKYQAGVDLTVDNAIGEKIKNGYKEIGNYAFFSSMQYDITGNFILQPSLRLIYNTEYEAPVIPSLNIKYDVSGMLTARASYAKGFRAPSLKELHFLFVDVNHNIRGAEDLDAETSDSYSIALNFHGESSEHAFKLEPTLFYNDIKNLISLANVENDLYSYVNIGKYETMGLNLNLSYYRPDINAQFGYSLLGKSYDINSVKNRDFVYSNEFQGNIIYTIPYIKTKAALFYKFTGARKGFTLSDEDEVGEYEIEDYHMLDFSLSKNIFWDELVLTAGVKNLLDVVNIDRTGTQSGEAHSGSSYALPIGWGRTFFVKLNYQFR